LRNCYQPVVSSSISPKVLFLDSSLYPLLDSVKRASDLRERKKRKRKKRKKERHT
jgi:hypothetical protein